MASRKQHLLHLLSFLLYLHCILPAGGISVKFGTSGGPIVPPPPPPPPVPVRPPYRTPAAVWEDIKDVPNPNPYKPPTPPQLLHYFTTKAPSTQSPLAVVPVAPPVQPTYTRYTHVVYSPKPPLDPVKPSISPAKAFVNAYAPTTMESPVHNAQQNGNQFQQNTNDNKQNQQSGQNNNQNQQSVSQYQQNGNQNGQVQQNGDQSQQTFHQYQQNGKQQDNQDLQSIDVAGTVETRYYGNQNRNVPELGIRYIPGFGFKYFTPEQDKDPRKFFQSSKYGHDKYNAIESNNIFDERQHQEDLDLTYEKTIAQRVKKSPLEQTYVPHQTFSSYNFPQPLFLPINYARH